MKNEDMKLMKKQMDFFINKNYKRSFSSKLSDFFENIFIFFIVCLALIFRPLNILIGGMILIIILLI